MAEVRKRTNQGEPALPATDEQVAQMLEAGFDDLWQHRCFARPKEARDTIAAGFENGKFGWYASRRGSHSTGLWRGPIFDDPLTAFVHAEIAGWKD